ncbi:MAG: hypothetical protein AAGG55_11020 [Pseudomonadota bacterium]
MAAELVPLGAPELGMTRGEMLEHIDFLWNYIHSQTEFTIQIVFAWLIAMFFTAKQLAKSQFIAAHVFYLLFLLRQYFAIADSQAALAAWYDRIALPSISDVKASDPLLVFYNNYLGPFFDQFLFLGVVAGTIWWAFSCRRERESTISVSAPD